MFSGVGIFVALAVSFNGVSPPPSGSAISPVFKKPVVEVRDQARPSFLQTIGRGAYLAYRATLSDAKGATCRFRPSCSLYGHQAIEHYGLIPGLVLFAARLVRAHLNYGELHFPTGEDFTILHSLEQSLPTLNPEEHLPWTALFNSR